MKKRIQNILFFFWRNLPSIRGSDIYFEGENIAVDQEAGFKWDTAQRVYNWTIRR